MCAADVDAEGPRGPCEARLQVDAQGKKLATKKIIIVPPGRTPLRNCRVP